MFLQNSTWSGVIACIFPEIARIGPRAASRHRLLISEPEYPETEEDDEYVFTYCEYVASTKRTDFY